VADRLLVDLGEDGLVTVGVAPDGGLYEQVSRAPLTWPLDGDALEDLRWYLEDYLAAPFGVWEDRGPRVQDRLAVWGEAVFASVFGSGPARDAYQRARDRGCELVFPVSLARAARLAVGADARRVRACRDESGRGEPVAAGR
jgi:hypothetical protein